MQDKRMVLFFQPNRYSKMHNSVLKDSTFGDSIDHTFLISETWDDFVLNLNLNPDLVGLHSDIFSNQEVSIVSLIKTIEIILKLKNKKAKIFVSISKDTDRSIVELLRKTNIAGLQLSFSDYGVEKASTFYKHLLENDSHWPEEEIVLLTYKDKKTPLHIYFREEHHAIISEDKLNALIENLPGKFRLCKDWNELSSVIIEQPTSITFHINMILRQKGTIAEFVSMLNTLTQYNSLSNKFKIAVVIEADTPKVLIRELQKNNIFSIIPSASSIGFNHCKDGIRALVSNIRYWPKNIIDSLPSNKKEKKSNTSLTERQQQVFDLIANRGLSNKQIARVLNISESTVKIHVSAVMKNLCVRNRTQLALTK